MCCNNYWNVEDIVEIKETKKKNNYSFWCCPQCGWDPSIIENINGISDYMQCKYYVEDEDLKILRDVWKPDSEDENVFILDEQKIAMITNVKKITVYPQIIGYSYDYWSGGYDWIEVHRCPNCDEEFEFCNGTH